MQRLLSVALLVLPISAWALDPETQAAKDEGMRLYNIGHSKPLPDTPVFEMYRKLDPTTLEHDRRTGRPPRYWRDMDDETYQQQVHAHQSKLDAFYRR